MTEAQALAYCRAGLDASEALAVLEAICAPLSQNDPVCQIVDGAVDKLNALVEAAQQQAERDHERCCDAMGRYVPTHAERMDEREGIDRMFVASEREQLGRAIDRLVSGFGELA